jgi:hypothetical protein
MILLNIYFSMITFLVSCIPSENNKTTITGTAWDAKRSAIIVNDSSGVYYIDKLASWDKSLYSKKVKVTGELIIEVNENKEEDVEVQEIEGEIKIIKKVKWVLIK